MITYVSCQILPRLPTFEMKFFQITVEAAVRVKADSGTVNLHAAVHPITDVTVFPPTIDTATEYAAGDYALTVYTL